MINLIPNVYQAAFMSRLGRGAIIKQVTKSTDLFRTELEKKAQRIYRKGFEEGEKSNVLGKEGAAYTAYLYIDSTGETKPNSFPTTLQLIDFIEVKGFSKLDPPFHYWDLNGTIFFDREEYFEAAYKVSNSNKDTLKAQHTAVNKTKESIEKGGEIVLTPTEKKRTYKTLEHINEMYLNYLFAGRFPTKHPKDENITVQHIELKKKDIPGDKLDIYKFVNYKDGKAFGEYKTEPIKETLETYEELLQGAVSSFTDAFNIETLEKNMTKSFKSKKLRSKKGLRSDINYAEEYKKLAYKNGKTNKDQVMFLKLKLEELELNRKALEAEGVKSVLRLLNNDTVIIKSEKGKYIPEKEEGVILSEEENNQHVEDNLLIEGDNTNDGQKKIAYNLLQKYRRSPNINKEAWIKKIKSIITFLKKSPNQYFHMDKGIFGLTLAPTKTVFGIPPSSDYLKKVEELKKSKETKTESFETIMAEKLKPIIETTNVLNPSEIEKNKKTVPVTETTVFTFPEDTGEIKETQVTKETTRNEKGEIINVIKETIMAGAEVKDKPFEYKKEGISKPVIEAVEHYLKISPEYINSIQELPAFLKKELLKEKNRKNKQIELGKNIDAIIILNGW